jgi:hypothetical protein
MGGNGGFYDDIAIPEVGYFSDFEQDDELAGGWLRAHRQQPASDLAPPHPSGRDTTVEYIPAADNTAEIRCTSGASSGMPCWRSAPRTTRQKAMPIVYSFWP